MAAISVFLTQIFSYFLQNSIIYFGSHRTKNFSGKGKKKTENSTNSVVLLFLCTREGKGQQIYNLGFISCPVNWKNRRWKFYILNVTFGLFRSQKFRRNARKKNHFDINQIIEVESEIFTFFAFLILQFQSLHARKIRKSKSEEEKKKKDRKFYFFESHGHEKKRRKCHNFRLILSLVDKKIFE